MRLYATKVWRTYWRPLVLAQEPFCPGYPLGYHKGRLVRTDSVDHITALRAGGPTVRANLRGLCHQCHSKKTADEDGGRSWR